MIPRIDLLATPSTNDFHRTSLRREAIIAVAMSIASWCLTSSVSAGEPLSWRRLVPGNTGVPGDTCSFVWIDEQDRPWVAAFTHTIWAEIHGGLGYHDGDRWNAISNVDHPQITSPVFNDMARDQNGILWIGTDSGLLRLDRAAGPEAMIRYDHLNSPMPASQIADVAVAPDNTLWIAIHDIDSAPSGGLAHFNPSTNAWQIWTAATGLPWGAAWPLFDWIDHVSVIPDAVGAGYTVWFTQQELGTGTYRNGQFTWFGQLADIISLDPPVPYRIPSDSATDSNGNLWLLMSNGTYARRNPDGSYHNAGIPPVIGPWSGAELRSLSNGRAVLHTQGNSAQVYDNGWFGVPDWGGANSRFAEESTGALWVAGNGGAARFDFETWTWRRHRFTNSSMISYFVEAIAFGAAGEVYLNGNAAPGMGGFNIFDGSHWVGANDFNYGFGPAWGLPSDDTAAMCVRANGHVAIVPEGQAVYDWDGVNYAQLIPAGYGPRRVAEDGLGRLWAPREFGWGLMLIDNGGFTEFFGGNSPIQNGSEVMAVMPDSSAAGFVWLAHNLGLAYTDGSTWTSYTRPQIGISTTDTGYIKCADRAIDGSFWFGTLGEGVVHFNPNTSQHTSYRAASGALPTDFITNIEIAPDGSIWAASMSPIWPYPGGLSHFDGQSWTTYSAATSPLPHNQNGCLASRPLPGGGYELWIGTISEGVAVITVAAQGMPGDIDGDGDVDVTDQLLFIGVLIGDNGNPSHMTRCDMTGDGLANGRDIQPFVDAMIGG